ncbi:MAG TPA: endolytic transglycosylase MltG [Gaiellaceae bacterium]|nr:endolytic transglycosylase MltG [Gaiellaceae bacterium]
MRRGRRIVVALALAVGLAAAPAASGKRSPTLRVVFPEGFTARQMADRVATVRRIAIAERHIRPVLTGRGYAAAVKASSPPAGFAGATSMEGFLFPSLYAFGPSSTPRDLIRLQLAAFRKAWAQLDLSAARAKGQSPYDVLIVASMVEREVSSPAERPLVAAVIDNRLAQGMPLGIDATLRYGLGIPGTKPLTAADLATDTPYNTRLHAGLPPTPIGNPGAASLAAAAAPADVPYLWYLRIPGTTTHYFTADYADFCAHVQQYGYGSC